MSRAKVCAVIVTYNGMQWIEKCLGSIKKSTFATDIIVVDNGSTDGTIDYLNDCKWIHSFHRLDKNLGFGKANNIGLKQGFAEGYDFFLLLNQDAWVDEEVIEKLVESMDQQGEFGISSPLHFEGSGMKLDYLFESYLSRTPSYQKDFEHNRVESKLYESPFVNAACWMIKRETLEKVGLFHPLFDHYGEDDNYIDRLHYAGLKLGLHPKLRIVHDRRQGVKNCLKDDPFRIFQRSTLRLLLGPVAKNNLSQSFRRVKKIANKESRKLPLIAKLKFRLRCYREFYKIWNQVKYFELNRQSELYLQ